MLKTANSEKGNMGVFVLTGYEITGKGSMIRMANL